MIAMRIAHHTLGCKVNQYDTQAMVERFLAAGWEECPFDADADVYLINTCTVTGTGDKKSVQLIRRAHRQCPEAAIIVAGCLAQRDVERVALPGVKLIIGSTRRGEVVELLNAAQAQAEPLVAVEPLKGAEFEPLTVASHAERTRAVMKIQEGCDRYCSYCIIPYVRGPVRSMDIDSVGAEARRLCDAGYSELVVTGIHLTSYGRGTEFDLLDALDRVSDPAGVKRIRLGSLEPFFITDERARRLSEMSKLCHQFHLSLQSGSDTVLSRMHRRYTTAEYMRGVEALRRYMPDCAITTDVIAGFPGETDAEFEQTIEFVRADAFARLHVFPYSRRSGTVADRMPDQVPEEIKRARTAALIETGRSLSRGYERSMLGSRREVLFETEIGGGVCEGYTREYVRVRAKAAPGEIKQVLLVSQSDDYITAVD